MQADEQPRVPEKLPPHSCAAASQRSAERSLSPTSGLDYDVPHHPLHPRGWHLQRHLKRKHLHRSSQRYIACDRLATRWSLLPLAFALLAFMVAAGSFLVGYSALAMAVDQHYQGDIVRLTDILPKDSLRMYDEHRTMIYEAVEHGLQISVPLN